MVGHAEVETSVARGGKGSSYQTRKGLAYVYFISFVIMIHKQLEIFLGNMGDILLLKEQEIFFGLHKLWWSSNKERMKENILVHRIISTRFELSISQYRVILNFTSSTNQSQVINISNCIHIQNYIFSQDDINLWGWYFAALKIILEKYLQNEYILFTINLFVEYLVISFHKYFNVPTGTVTHGIFQA